MATAATPDMKKLGDELYGHWERAMGTWWDQVLESPAFLGAMGKNLEGTAKARGQYERSVDDTMEKLHLPTRGDLIRVARVSTLLEEKLLQQEDLVLELKDRLAGMEREVVQARIEAAEARLELREGVQALRDDIAALRRQDATAESGTATSATPSASTNPAPVASAAKRRASR